MTPLQKLIKQFEEIKDSNLESSIDVGFAISLAKSMLEKEKEYMRETIGEQDLNARIAELEWEVSGLKEEIKNL